MLKHEIYRKLIHLGSLVIPFLYYFYIRNAKIAVAILLPIALLCLIIDASRMENPKLKNKFYKLFGANLRAEETTQLTGASYLLTSSVVSIVIFPREIAFLAISYLAIGDTFAALVGQSFGKRKIKHTNKTLEGLLGSFVSCSIFGLFIYFLKFQNVYTNPLTKVDSSPYVIMILAGALTASVVEVIDFHINDNITIPIISGVVMSVFFIII